MLIETVKTIYHNLHDKIQVTVYKTLVDNANKRIYEVLDYTINLYNREGMVDEPVDKGSKLDVKT